MTYHHRIFPATALAAALGFNAAQTPRTRDGAFLLSPSSLCRTSYAKCGSHTHKEYTWKGKRHNSYAILAAFLCTAALPIFARAALPPDAGSTLHQISEVPVPSKATPEIRIEQGAVLATPAADGMKIQVGSLHISGAQIYGEAELLAASGFMPGSELTLNDLRALATKIADYYHRHGYFVAQAYLPAQNIKDGKVTIEVLEGRYGKVTVNNQSNLAASLISQILDGLNSGAPIAVAPLEDRLLWLSDIPGVDVKSTLIPGASVGSSDLVLEVMPGKRVTGSADADNEGNRYTGANRMGATVNLNDLSGHGDIATVRALTSFGGMDYGRVAYQVQIGRAKAGIAYSRMKYRLGEDFASLKANGTADISSIYASYPAIRSRNSNLYAQLAYDDKAYQDKVDSTLTANDKKAKVWMLSINGDSRDNLGGGGVNNYSVTYTSGTTEIQSPAALALDNASSKTNGSYNKISFTAGRLQSVTDTVSFNISINGQVAAKNLDTAEKMGLGGANGVRAYPEGEAYGDQGYVLNLESRMLLPKFSERMAGRMQLVGFIDTGTVTLNKNPWTARENRRTLSGAGVGLNWMDSESFLVRAYYAHKVGRAVATSAPDTMSRFWIQGVKYF